MKHVSPVRRLILAVLFFGLAGTIAELLLIEHYEDTPQLLPIALLVFALAVVVWHVAQPGAASVQALQVVMALFVIAGVMGIVLHYRGAAEFQRELNPEIGDWDMFKKVIRVKAPPVLAPGMMLQLGLLGLSYGYRHPALSGTTSQSME